MHLCGRCSFFFFAMAYSLLLQKPTPAIDVFDQFLPAKTLGVWCLLTGAVWIITLLKDADYNLLWFAGFVPFVAGTWISAFYRVSLGVDEGTALVTAAAYSIVLGHMTIEYIIEHDREG